MSVPEIEAWFVSYIAKLVNVPEGEVDIDEEFTSLGVSSAEAVILTGDLERWLVLLCYKRPDNGSTPAFVLLDLGFFAARDDFMLPTS